MSDAAAPVPIEFFFDPMCPYAYQTSVWIRRGLDLGVRRGDDRHAAEFAPFLAAREWPSIKRPAP